MTILKQAPEVPACPSAPACAKRVPTQPGTSRFPSSRNPSAFMKPGDAALRPPVVPTSLREEVQQPRSSKRPSASTQPTRWSVPIAACSSTDFQGNLQTQRWEGRAEPQLQPGTLGSQHVPSVSSPPGRAHLHYAPGVEKETY